MANQNGTQTQERDLGAMVEKAGAVVEKAGAMVEKARGQIEDYAGDARRRMDDIDRRVSDAVRENPLLVLGAAVGVGYVIGRIFSRVR